MAIPKQVSEGAAEADVALRAFLAVAPPAPAPTDPPAPTNEVVPPAPAPQPAPAPAPQPVVVPTDHSAELATLRQQLSSLQGMFSSTQQQLAAARADLETLRAQPAPAPAPAAPQAQRLLTEAEIAEYGEPFIDVVRRAVREDIMPIIQPLLGRVESLERGVSATRNEVQTVARTVAETEEDKFWKAVGEAVPNYDAINVDPRFIAWLQQPARYSKNTKHELLIQAATSLDASTVASFYNDWASEAGIAPTPTPAPVPTPTPAPAPAVDPAASLIAPSASAPGTPDPSAVAGQIWTQRDVDELYRRQLKGMISKEDFDRLEADLIAATYEGRVRG